MSLTSAWIVTAIDDAVNAELAEGTQLGIRGTPAFFINGPPRHQEPSLFPSFQQVIEQLLENG